MTTVPDLRIRRGNSGALNSEGSYILYWMTAFRRLGWNFSLQHAADLAREMRKPLMILEIVKVDYPYASHRLHTFLLQGVGERARALAGEDAVHYPFVESEPGEGDVLLQALAADACCVVTDDFPSFFLPRRTRTVGSDLDIRLDLVDSNGLLPLRAADQTFKSAYHFRRFLQAGLPEHLPERPDPEPLKEALPGPGSSGESTLEGLLSGEFLKRWRPAPEPLLKADAGALNELALDASVPPVPLSGTTREARGALEAFLREGLSRYAEDARHPDAGATSGLSPFLHFGAISTHEIVSAVMEAEGWTPLRLSDDATGAREGWWGMGDGAEAFLDQLVTWRELGFNMSWREDDLKEYESLPKWARETLEEHEADERPYLYELEELREARTHDELWNAAQNQLSREGVIHNYLRMLWGKKILEWTPSAREALDVMIELNDRYAVDGRDPNSYSGIFWCLGRYDRGWPEREIFGKVRSMTSKSTRRKIKMDRYLEQFS